MKNFWEPFIYSGMKTTDLQMLRKAIFINAFSLIGFFFVTFLGLQNVIARNFQSGIPELLGGFVFLLTILLLRINHNLLIARSVMLATLGSLLLVGLATGGVERTGIFWYFTFPLVAFFLCGRQLGIIWTLLLCCATSLVALLGTLEFVSLAYSLDELRQLFISLFACCVLIYIYQQVVEHTQEQEKNLDTAKTEFVTLASHQLRTPISAIAWYTEMLMQGDIGSVTSEQKEHLMHIYQSNERMAALVDELLHVSQLETGNFFLKPEFADLTQISHSVLIKELQKQEHKELRIQENYDDKLPKVFIDTEVAKIIFQTLLSNALKYTPEKGSVSIAIAPSEQDPAVGTEKKAGILITVTDTGYGIPKREAAKIFSKLFRAANIKTKDTDGTGLGLYMVKSLVGLIGGRVWFTSEENKGSSFFVWIPSSSQ